MCGIFGCILKNGNAAPIIHAALKRLEYRGYDSCGEATIHNGRLFIKKDAGKIDEVHARYNLDDLPGRIGIGHCLTPDTYVLLSDGEIRKISELTDKDAIMCIGLDNLVCKYTSKIKIATHKSPPHLYEVKTSYFSFKCTGDHRVFVATKEGKIKAKKVKELTGEELIPIIRRNLIKDNDPPLLTETYFERHYKLTPEVRRGLREEVGYNIGFEGFPLKPSSEVTHFLIPPARPCPELLQIVGYHLGNGYTSKRFLKYKEEKKEVIEKYRGLFEKLFNVSGSLKREGNFFVLRIHSSFLVTWFQENFESAFAPHKKDIPPFIGRLPDDQLASFLRGVFDAEGSIDISSRQISLRMTSRQVVQKIQLLLLRFGVLSTYSQSASRRGWRRAHGLYINDAKSIDKFSREIGFSSKEKQRRLDQLIKGMDGLTYKHFSLPIRCDCLYWNHLRGCNVRLHGVNRSYLTDYRLHREILPKLEMKKRELEKKSSSELREMREVLGLSMRKVAEKMGVHPNTIYLLEHGKLNDSSLQRKIAKLIENKRRETLEKLERTLHLIRTHLESDLVWVRPKIKKVRAEGDLLYDIEVEGDHNFIGNGIVQHNSRWATHGAPSQVNAHPHVDCSGQIAVVHNGIIENFAELRAELEGLGHVFHSKTDTEVIPHLIEERLKGGLTFIEALREAINRLEGYYAIAIISIKEPDKIFCSRRESPLVVGIAENAAYCASDIPAFLPLTNKAVIIENGEFVVLSDEGYEIRRIADWSLILREPRIIDWSPEMTEKQGYPHFMLKEIHEQHLCLKNALRLQEQYLELMTTFLDRAGEVFLVACGTSYHACLAASYMFSKLAFLATHPVIASEFIEQHGKAVNIDSTILAVSQSGETADTLAAVEHARLRAATILGLTNVIGSTLTRVSRVYVCQQSGPEIGVAATKTFTSQLSVLSQLALRLAKKRGKVSHEEIEYLEEKLEQIPDIAETIIQTQEEKIKQIAKKYRDRQCFVFLGRGISSATALEGRLKLLEIAYIPSIAFPAGESKHGPISLIEPGFPVIFICTRDETHKIIIGNIMEMKARGASIITIIEEGDEEIKALADDYIEMAKGVPEVLSPILYVIPLQLLAYYMAIERGCDPDMPRHLAKSVTVK